VGCYWTSDAVPDKVDLSSNVQGIEKLCQLPNHERLIVWGAVAGGETTTIDVIRHDGMCCGEGRGKFTDVERAANVAVNEDEWCCCVGRGPVSM